MKFLTILITKRISLSFTVLILITILSMNNILLAQNQLKTLPVKSGMDESATLHKIQKAFNDYWESYNVKDGYFIEDGVKKKAPGWKIFKRWEWYWENRVNIETGEFPTTTSDLEYEKSLIKQNEVASLNENWVNLGTSSSTGGYAGIGRINCIAFHPSDANTIWVGSPSGGIWKTTNGGSSWTILNNNETVLGVSDIAIPSDYTSSNTMYIATGDRDGGSMWSLGGGQWADNNTVGVYKSTDGGANWSATGLTYSKSSGVLVTRLLIHPTNPAILYASLLDYSSGFDGIYKSTNSGTSWSKIYPYTPFLLIDMEFKPGDPNTIYASSMGYGAGYIFTTTNGGTSWSIGATITNGYRVELAVTPNNSAIVYALVSNSSGGLVGVYKSTNSGVSFAQINTNTSQNMLGYYSDGSGANTGQGTYDLCIAASPTNANTVYIGGINNWKSTDGGVNWTINNMWTSHPAYNFVGAPEVHADKHVLAFQTGTILFEGNDGGIYKTTNGGTNWTDLTDGMVISQIYRIGVAQTDADIILTGLQDNGSKKCDSPTWTDVYGGDGMECIVDHTSATTYMYVTLYFGNIQRSSNGFSTLSTTQISANIPGGQPQGAWVTPYIMDPTNSAILYAGYDRIWKTTDRGNSWTSASQILSPSSKLRSLAIAPSNTNVLYSADLTNMWKTTDGGATNWTSVTLPASSNSLTYIAVKNNDPNTVWITFGGYTDGAKVYESTNGGSSWTNISAGLPNLPVMCIVHYKTPTDRNVLFVGTDLGVYAKDGTNNWAAYNTGLPNVVVTELDIYYGGGVVADKLRAGTYGRGLWETEILAPLPVELTSFTASVVGSSVKLNWRTETEVNNYGFDIERTVISNEVKNLSWEKIGFVEGFGTSNSPKDYSFTDASVVSGTYSYRLKQIDNNGIFSYSKIVEVDLGVPKKYELAQNFPNPFNPNTSIRFSLPETGNVKLTVYNMLGQKIATLVNEVKEAGTHIINFNAEELNSGVYIYRIECNGFNEVRKMTLIK